MPPDRKKSPATQETLSGWVTATLNWSAFLIGFGLCLWMINNSVGSPEYTHAPLSSGVVSAED
jgi:hypothetical protein